MTVVDLRNIFSQRNIQLFDVNSSYLYYAEEKKSDTLNELLILEYNRGSRRERLITNYSLEDPAFVSHLFAFSKTIVLVLENGSNSMWIIEIDKQSGIELNRRKVVCTGAFKSCMALDSSHLLIYMAPDSENAEMFQKYREITGCECLSYIYNLKTNEKQFIKAPLIAKLGTENIKLLTIHGDKYVILADPFADEEIKKGYYEEQRWINADIRDNIWICSLNQLESELEAGSDNITKKCIASADIKALVRYMGISGEKIFFRAKDFRNGAEKLCSYDASAESLNVEMTLEPQSEGNLYLAEEKPFRLFSISINGHYIHVRGLANSEADFAYDSDMGQLVTCIENRYAVTCRRVYAPDGVTSFDYYFIYDAMLDKNKSYQCRCHVCDNTLVIY